jgi:signal peptidase II
LKVLFATLFIVIADQLTKFFVKGGTIPILNLQVEGMRYGESINVLGDFFKITFVENPGLAFGIDVNETSKLLLSLFSLLASIGIFYYLYKSSNQKFIVRLALALILGGAIGNLIDRTFYGLFYGYAPIFYGKVVDFFNVDFFDFTIFGRTFDRWPIFNIADASVTVGVIGLLIFHKSVPETDKSAEVTSSETIFIHEQSLSDQLPLGKSDEIELAESGLKNVEDNIRKEN